MSSIVRRFARQAEKQLAADSRWMAGKGWSQRTIDRRIEDRRKRLDGWQNLSPRDAAVFLIAELHRPRARRIGTLGKAPQP